MISSLFPQQSLDLLAEIFRDVFDGLKALADKGSVDFVHCHTLLYALMQKYGRTPPFA